MGVQKKQNKDHIAVISNAKNYTIIALTFNPTTDQCIINSYKNIAVQGEFCSYFFINHTLFFKNITHATQECIEKPSIALLFAEPFISSKKHAFIPSIIIEDRVISHPLLLQCAIIPPLYSLHITSVTSVESAYQFAIASTGHSEDEYSFSRLISKKDCNDFISKELHYPIIAAYGSYIMEHT